MKTDLKPLQKRFASVEARIAQTLQRSGRSREELTVVAVTKRQPMSAVLEAHRLGHRHFGESQVQEGVPKVKASPDDIDWHFVGHLQKNKVRQAVQFFDYIHSVDGLKLLRRIDRIAGEERVRPKILLQVNLAGDPDKFGLHPDRVSSVLQIAMECTHLSCVGLMVIPPLNYGVEEARSFFRSARTLSEELMDELPSFPGLLSMGMSRDYALAIEEGSDFVRIGTDLFGART